MMVVLPGRAPTMVPLVSTVAVLGSCDAHRTSAVTSLLVPSPIVAVSLSCFASPFLTTIGNGVNWRAATSVGCVVLAKTGWTLVDDEQPIAAQGSKRAIARRTWPS